MKEAAARIISTVGTEQELQFNAEQLRVKKYNASAGTLLYHNCDKCKNKGRIAYINSQGTFALKQCECMTIRKSKEMLSKSGLTALVEKYTFNNYVTNEKWQESIKNAAKSYICDTFGNWFFIGGQVGAGKSHICTAIANELLNNGKMVCYMLWRDDVVALKANVNNYEQYEKRIKELKTVSVLYIDDFFKTERGKAPTPADINIAFELLNYRYNNPELTTIISTELQIRDIISLDEAVGSRIYERSKKYQININADINKNYRLR